MTAIVLGLAGTAAAAAADFDAERGLPLLRRFLPEDYQGHYQVNDLAVAADGRLYGTSQRAVLRYDGAHWERLDFPAQWAWRLTAAADGRIYVSGDEEIGYYEEDAAGRTAYVSLVGEVPAEAKPLGNVRGAKSAGDTVVFAAEKGWLVRRDGRFTFTAAPVAGRTQVHAAGGKLYASGTEAGLRRWDGQTWQVFATAPTLARSTVTGLAPLPDGRLLAMAAPGGLLVVGADGSGAAPWTGPAAAAFAAARPLGLMALPDGRIAAFTRQSGLVIAASDGSSLVRYDKSHGLPSNTTYGLAVDRDGGLWAGGTNGLVRVDLVTPATVFDERNGPGPGGMRSFSRQDGVFYAGVVDAVHRLVPADPATGRTARFEAVPGTTAIVNDLASHPRGLLVAMTGGLFVYRPDTGFRPVLSRAEDISVVWTTPADPERVYLGADKSVVVGRLGPGGFVVDHESTAAGFAELITPIGADTIWVGTRGRGFFRLRAGAGADGWQQPALDAFGETEGLPPTRHYTAVFRTPWGVGLHSSDGIWRLDEAARRLVPEPAFRFPDGARHAFPGTLDSRGRLWASGGRVADRTGRPLGWYAFGENPPRGPAAWQPVPPALQPLAGAYGFLNFHADPASPGGEVIWAKSPSAVVRIEADRLAATRHGPWQPRLQAVLAAGRSWPLRTAAMVPPRFPASAERIVFRFGPGRMDAGNLTYRTRLVGHGAAWSPPSPHPEISYTNLEGGPFVLEVVATDAAGGDSEVLRYPFAVAVPWHRTGAAFVGYGAALLAAMGGFVRWRLGRAERERRRLEAVVAERTRDLAAARDQAEAASRAKSAFLAAMSHELRTPLNGVIGYAQLLQRDARLAADQRERVRIVHQSGEHLLRMINDVLDLAKIEAGKIELRPAPFALAELVADVAAAHAPAAAAKRLAFAPELAPGLPAWVEGDAQKLRQVLDNLLGNAVKFTARGGIALRVAAGPAAPGRVALRISVTDTGPGIAPDDRERLFRPFEQARAERPAAPGTGLGLAISRALVERMGGTLVFDSTPGAGSTFRVDLDLPAVASPADRAPAPAVTGYAGARRRLLVVDDHAVNRSLLTDLLAPLGFACGEAASGEAALARLADGEEPWPDLAIVDLRMDGIDGLELTRRLRALPRGADLRVLLTSASVLSFDPAEARAAGCDDFLPKPFRTEDLVAKLGALLGLRWLAPIPEAAPAGAVGTAPLPDAVRAELRDVLAEGDLEAFRLAVARLRPAHPAAAAQWDALDAAAAGFQLSRLRQLLDSP